MIVILKIVFTTAKNTISRENLSFAFVASIPAHLTWSKVLMLPQVLNAQECHQQCKFVIEKKSCLFFRRIVV